MEPKQLAKHWWAILIRGIVAVIFAILLVTATGFTLEILIILLGVYLLLDGLLAVIASFVAASNHKSWWLLLFEGLITLAAGIFVFASPSLTLVILVYLVAAWAIITGLLEFVASLIATWAIPGKVFLGVTGVLSVILGIIIFLYPVISLVTMVWLVAIYGFVVGLSLIIFSFKLKAAS